MAHLDVGDRVPDFTATLDNGETFQLADQLGKGGLVVFFYPRSGTSICTKEACGFRDSYEKFAEAGVQVLGVSSDNAARQAGFIRKHDLPFRLVSDSKGELRKVFGVPHKLGLIPGRTTFVIDRDGIVRLRYSALFASQEHVDAALKEVGQFAEAKER